MTACPTLAEREMWAQQRFDSLQRTRKDELFVFDIESKLARIRPQVLVGPASIEFFSGKPGSRCVLWSDLPPHGASPSGGLFSASAVREPTCCSMTSVARRQRGAY